jgi:DNA-directed RNA polymerase specialized sigma24 family protein
MQPMTRAESGDALAALLNDSRYGRIVRAAARHYYRLARHLEVGRDFDEFYAAAVVGLWKACRKRDPAMGPAFLRFAKNKVRWECADLLRAMARRSARTSQWGGGGPGVVQPPPTDLADYLPAGDPRGRFLEGYFGEGRNVCELARRSGLSREAVRKTILSALADIRQSLEVSNVD